MVRVKVRIVVAAILRVLHVIGPVDHSQC